VARQPAVLDAGIPAGGEKRLARADRGALRLVHLLLDQFGGDILAHVVGHIRRRHGIEPADPRAETPRQRNRQPGPHLVTRIEGKMNGNIAVTHRPASFVMAVPLIPPATSTDLSEVQMIYANRQNAPIAM